MNIFENMDNTDNSVVDSSEVGITENMDNTDNSVVDSSEVDITENMDNSDNSFVDSSGVYNGSSSGNIDLSAILEKMDIIIENTDNDDSMQEIETNTEFQTLYSNIEDLRSTDILLLLILIVLLFNFILKIGGKIF